MSWKDKITSLLFGSTAAENVDKELPEEQAHTPPPIESAPEAVPEDPSLLDVPADHPIRQLYSIRQQEAHGLSPIRLCMDEFTDWGYSWDYDYITARGTQSSPLISMMWPDSSYSSLRTLRLLSHVFPPDGTQS